MIEMLEVVQRCEHCKREMRVSSIEYEESPFCQKCLAERLSEASAAAGPMRWDGDFGYLTLVPVGQKTGRDASRR